MEHKTIQNSNPRRSKKTKDVIDVVESDLVSSSEARKSKKDNAKRVKSDTVELELKPNSEPPAPDGSPIKVDMAPIEPEKKAEADDEKSYGIFISKFSKLIAEDFWETAWDICETRFYHDSAPQQVVSDLRDTWLSIIEMQWMDTEPSVLKQVQFPTYPDSVPLPPNFDLWSHGALEILPRNCRESVLDPFLREPFSWLKYEEDGYQAVPISTESSTLAIFDDSRELFPINELQLVRPTSPVPTTSTGTEEEEYSESTWSMASTRGSTLPLSAVLALKDSSIEHFKSSESLAFNNYDKEKTRSIEFLYPSRIPRTRASDIRALSEIEYQHHGKGVGGFKGSGDGSKQRESLVAFKLPRQTSSESIRKHYERQLQKETVKKTSSSSGDK